MVRAAWGFNKVINTYMLSLLAFEGKATVRFGQSRWQAGPD